MDLSKEKALAPTEGKQISIPQDDFFASLDNKEVVNYLATRVEKAWVYEFKMKDKMVRNLGCDGATETALALSVISKGRYVIRTVPQTLVMTDMGDSFDAEIQAEVCTVGVDGNGNVVKIPLSAVIGYASQPKVIKKRDGTPVPVNHPKTQAAHKAQRNAYNRLIPEKLREIIIGEAIKRKKLVRDEEDTLSGTPSEPKKSGGKVKGSGGMSEAQENEIAQLLADERVPQELRDKIDKKVAEGMTAKRASEALIYLKGVIEAAKAREV